MQTEKNYKITHGEDVFANAGAHVNEIENFWGVAKDRLVKIRGITGEKIQFTLARN